MNHTANWPWIHEDRVCFLAIFVLAGAVLMQEQLPHSKGALVMARSSLADVNCRVLAASERLHVDCNTFLPIYGMVCATRAMYNSPLNKMRNSLLPYHALLLPLLLTLWAHLSSPAPFRSRHQLITPTLQTGEAKGETT